MKNDWQYGGAQKGPHYFFTGERNWKAKALRGQESANVTKEVFIRLCLLSYYITTNAVETQVRGVWRYCINVKYVCELSNTYKIIC